MGQNKTYIIILILSLSASILIGAGIFLFSPLRSNTAASEENTFDPYTYINEPEVPQDPPQQETNQEAEQVSESESLSSSENSASSSESASQAQGLRSAFSFPQPLALSRSNTPLVLHQKQVYGPSDQAEPPNEAELPEPSSEIRIVSPSASKQSPSEEPIDPQEQTQNRPQIQTPVPKQEIAETRSQEIPPPSANQTREAIVASASAKVAGNAITSEAHARPASESSTSAGDSTQYRSNTEYWIQLFSSTSQQVVLDLSKELGRLGIRSKMTSYTQGDTVLFRLRFGPFKVFEEAEKFQTWIQELDTYRNTYISQQNRR